ncbi:hypothetical protein [uncultured Cetobacterium sp.]|uniref:hypothetical protein n=1 Tax=uncultured Cetobacterium sp. TaxID=527638 RepID=UPI00262F5B89|nr:hypothetical protein [uncultured Cetobacterium sp.]
MLKFITEEYLRELYRKESFECFQIEENQRLTPGGRQYLLDKKVRIENFDENKKKTQVVLYKKNIYKLRSLEMEIYSLVSELLNKNIKVAAEILEIGKVLKNVSDTLEGKCELLKLQEEISCSESQEPNESYLYFKNGRYIYSLKKLIFELHICKELFVKNENITENVDWMISKIERILLHIMEEL